MINTWVRYNEQYLDLSEVCYLERQSQRILFRLCGRHQDVVVFDFPNPAAAEQTFAQYIAIIDKIERY